MFLCRVLGVRLPREYRVEAAHRVIDRNRRVAEVARELALHEYLLHKWVVDERRRMAAASLQDNRGNKQEAARALGMSRATIYRKINDYRIA